MSCDSFIIEKLCRACGLCCNGVIFADVQLQPSDNAERLQALGLKFKPSSWKQSAKVAKFVQPCGAFKEDCCQIYRDRPQHCRKFECALLKNANTKTVSIESALKTIRIARRRAEKVRHLLEKLGDNDESLALGKRFQKMQKRMESLEAEANSAVLFGDLTIAMHQLNVLLSEKFYPGT